MDLCTKKNSQQVGIYRAYIFRKGSIHLKSISMGSLFSEIGTEKLRQCNIPTVKSLFQQQIVSSVNEWQNHT
jgi:hypothetical protein